MSIFVTTFTTETLGWWAIIKFDDIYFFLKILQVHKTSWFGKFPFCYLFCSKYTYTIYTCNWTRTQNHLQTIYTYCYIYSIMHLFYYSCIKFLFLFNQTPLVAPSSLIFLIRWQFCNICIISHFFETSGSLMKRRSHSWNVE